jgi:hypothetical protein
MDNKVPNVDNKTQLIQLEPGGQELPMPYSAVMG